MKLDYKYRSTKTLENFLHQLDVNRKLIDLLPQLPRVEENLRRKSLLKSSLYSARIEGNSLTIDRVSDKHKDSESISKKEVVNIFDALRFIYLQSSRLTITLTTLLTLHKYALNDISDQAGRLRSEPSAIFNQAGIAVYMTPPPSEIKTLLPILIKIANSDENPGPINAAICHFAFEKIHPFLDGNGRVGRLFSTLILKNAGYGYRGIVSFEQYLEDQREGYYGHLLSNGKDITEFVEFFLEALYVGSEKAIESIKNVKSEVQEDSLLPRRREILEIVRDHQMVTFDFIKRRFVRIPVSTLHFDLKALIRGGFIKKLGSTRGVVYTPGDI